MYFRTMKATYTWILVWIENDFIVLFFHLVVMGLDRWGSSTSSDPKKYYCKINTWFTNHSMQNWVKFVRKIGKRFTKTVLTLNVIWVMSPGLDMIIGIIRYDDYSSSLGLCIICMHSSRLVCLLIDKHIRNKLVKLFSLN